MSEWRGGFGGAGAIVICARRWTVDEPRGPRVTLDFVAKLGEATDK